MASGTVVVPGHPAGGEALRLRLGCAEAEVVTARGQSDGDVLCAPDVWRRLAVPLDGLAMQMRETTPGEIDLGPTIAVLYSGDPNLRDHEVRDRARKYYGHLKGHPGLLTFAFDAAIDWAQGTMIGYVLDNRPGKEGELSRGIFPIPQVVRLTWAIRRDVIAELKERTGNRTFNWLRSLNKWSFHKHLVGTVGVGEYLPDTRKLRGEADLLVMLAKYRQVYLKHVHGIMGRQILRVRHLETNLHVTYMRDGKQMETHLLTPKEVLDLAGHGTGNGSWVIQQGIATAGRTGRALHFRIVTVRRPGDDWAVVLGIAHVAPDKQLCFTNEANGAVYEEMAGALQTHHGMDALEASLCVGEMKTLCLAAARRLAEKYDPLGILGFDVVVDGQTHRPWLLEANPVPGWKYSQDVDTALAQSQIDYARWLSGYTGE